MMLKKILYRCDFCRITYAIEVNPHHDVQDVRRHEFLWLAQVKKCPLCGQTVEVLPPVWVECPAD